MRGLHWRAGDPKRHRIGRGLREVKADAGGTTHCRQSPMPTTQAPTHRGHAWRKTEKSGRGSRRILSDARSAYQPREQCLKGVSWQDLRREVQVHRCLGFPCSLHMHVMRIASAEKLKYVVHNSTPVQLLSSFRPGIANVPLMCRPHAAQVPRTCRSCVCGRVAHGSPSKFVEDQIWPKSGFCRASWPNLAKIRAGVGNVEQHLAKLGCQFGQHRARTVLQYLAVVVSLPRRRDATQSRPKSSNSCRVGPFSGLV